MSEKSFLCWDVDDADEPDAVEHKEYCADWAAEAHAKHLNDRESEWRDGTIAVKHPDGKVEHYDISHDWDIRFYASASFDQPGDEEAA